MYNAWSIVPGAGPAAANGFFNFAAPVFWQALAGADVSRTGAGGVPRALHVLDRTHVAGAPVPVGVTVVESPGVIGQGPVANPPPWFDAHCVVRVGQLYYDPSYGMPTGISTLMSAEDLAFARVAAVFLGDTVPVGGKLLHAVVVPYIGVGAPTFECTDYLF